MVTERSKDTLSRLQGIPYFPGSPPSYFAGHSSLASFAIFLHFPKSPSLFQSFSSASFPPTQGTITYKQTIHQFVSTGRISPMSSRSKCPLLSMAPNSCPNLTHNHLSLMSLPPVLAFTQHSLSFSSTWVTFPTVSPQAPPILTISVAQWDS